MKLSRQKREELTSATIIHSLGIIAGSSTLFALTALAADPSWWSSPGSGTQGAVVAEEVVTNDGVVSTNYITNDYAVVVQGQLKQFTARAVDELNANLSGGAGTNLNTMVSNWAADYATNGYNATNVEPSDYTAMTVGQLKYVGNMVWTQLMAGGYTNALPAWLDTNATDTQLANVGQLKQVFNFDLSAGPAPVTGLTATIPTSGEIDLSWTLPATNNATSITIQQSTDGGLTWTTVATLDPTATSYDATGLDTGTSYEYQVTTGNSSGSSSSGATASQQPQPPPPTPTCLTGTIDGSGYMNLTWQASAGATGYVIDRETVATGVWQTNFATTPANSYQDTTPDGHAYRVSAYNSIGTSASSGSFPLPRYAVMDLTAIPGDDGPPLSNVKITPGGNVLISMGNYGNSLLGWMWTQGTLNTISLPSGIFGGYLVDCNDAGTVLGNFEYTGSSDDNSYTQMVTWSGYGTGSPSILPLNYSDTLYGGTSYANFLQGNGTIWSQQYVYGSVTNEAGFGDGFDGSTELGTVSQGVGTNGDLPYYGITAVGINSTGDAVYATYWCPDYPTDDLSSGPPDSNFSFHTPNGVSSFPSLPYPVPEDPCYLSERDVNNNVRVAMGNIWLAAATGTTTAALNTVTSAQIFTGINNATRTVSGVSQPAFQLIGVDYDTDFALSSLIYSSLNSLDGHFGAGAVWTMNPKTQVLGAPEELDSLISSGSEWQAIQPSGINSGGAIVGAAVQLDAGGNPITDDYGDPIRHAIMLLPMQIVTDLNGDGTIDNTDAGLESQALNPSATDDQKKDETEYLFPDDTISHGIWSKTDSNAPSGTTDDDNAKQIQITCGATFGSVWFDYTTTSGPGTITNLVFYKTRACNSADKITFPLAVSSTSPMPTTLYVRVEGTVSAETDGNLVMKLGTADKSQTFCQVSMPLDIVTAFGDAHFFQAANRYILQNNCLHYFGVKTYGSVPIDIVVRSEDYSTMQAVDAYWNSATGAVRSTVLYGIQRVQPAYPNVDEIINGNFCGTRVGTLFYDAITTTCLGNLITGGALDAKASTSSTSPTAYLEGSDARYLAMGSPHQFTFGTGIVPTTSGYQEALGGLGPTGSSDPHYFPIPYNMNLIGEAPVDSKHKVLFTLSYQATSKSSGTVSASMVSDATSSGCPPFPGGTSGEPTLVWTDGSSSIALALKSPPDTSAAGTSGVAGIPTYGTKHTLPTPLDGYYINTYLIFDSTKPRP